MTGVQGCPQCGGVVSVHRTMDGAKYYTAVSDAHIPALLKLVDVDAFMADRLHRAEKIIVDLRKQLKEQL